MAVAERPGTLSGTALRRKEDPELLTGQARFVDDLTLPGMVWMAVVRSPYAHARIASVDVSEALRADGVVAAFSGSDLEDEWAAPLPMAWPVTEDIKNPPHWPLSRDKARYAGDGVAVVIAESRAAAKDAAELVDVEYEPLPAVTAVEAALAESAPLVHDDLDTNRCYTWALAAGDVDRLFSEADVTVRERYYQNRLVPNAIEPRGVLVQPVPAQGEYTVWSATQIPHILRVLLAMTLGIPEAKLRVIAPEVGGGFGSKLNVYAEEVLAVTIARKLGLPVKWIEERSEAYLATIHGRDVIQEIELAATADGDITAVRTRLTASMGAYLQLTSSARASSRTRRRPTPIAAQAGPSRRMRSSARSTRSRASWTRIRSS
jgi:carbon-monoxide dehydrogenase large subunit